MKLAARILLLLLGLMAASMPASGQEQAVPQRVPVGGGQHVDIWAPEPARQTGFLAVARKAPVILYVHGGGWIKGESTKVYDLPGYAASRGYLLVSASYRPVPRTSIDGQVADVVRAINWTRANIAKHGGDPRRIVIMGHSAGAHLVSLVAAQKKAGQIRGVVANDVQAYDLVAYNAMRGGMAIEYQRAFGANPANWIKWSPVTYLKRGSGYPPFLVMYSRSDRPRRAQLSIAFGRELQKRGTRVTFFDGARYTHGSIATSIGKSAEVTGALDRFLTGAFGRM